jgi:hypothetical protein
MHIPVTADCAGTCSGRRPPALSGAEGSRAALLCLRVLCAPLFVLSVLILFLLPSAHAINTMPQKKPREEKPVPQTVWNFDGGIFFATDGSVPGGACFRLFGRMTASGFFDNLKRIDDAHGTRYVQGTETLTQFPDEVQLHFSIRDFPCSPQLEQTNARTVLTRSVMSSMQLYLYWKRGLELRPVENPKVEHTSVAPIVPYAVELAGQLPERYEWSYEVRVPSAGVPLTDDLVLILRNPDGKIAARVAARL